MRKIFILITALSFITYSCEDMEFIEPKPLNLITAEIALSDLNGIEAVLASGYNRLMNFNYYGQQMMIMPDALADNVVVNNNTGRYVDEQANVVRAHLDLWNDPANPNAAGYTVRSAYNAYRTINDANIVLNALDNVELGEGEQDRAAQLRGEALFIRALSYFDLLRVYAYEPGQEVNGWNTGVVMRTEPVLGAADADNRERGTNIEGYEQVESDLLAAIPLLDDEVADNAHRASNVAAEALLARVYLYWGRYADAATRAESVLNSTIRSITPAEDYTAMWQEAVNPEAIFEVRIDVVDWNTVDGVNNSLTTVTRTVADGIVPQGATKASAEMIAAYEDGDVRRDLWVNPSGPDTWESEKWYGALGQGRQHIPLIRYSEVLLIAAEGRARSGGEAAGLAHVNTLRTNRGLAESTATGSALTDLILQERRVELCLEGHRFFDFKRLGLNIPKTVEIVGGTPVAYTDFRILAPLNQDYLAINDLAVDNPGYTN